MLRISGIAGRGLFGLAFVLIALLPAQSVSAKSKEIVLYSFKGGHDGAFPAGRLYLDDSGNLYGTTANGGGTGCGGGGCGTVFKLAPDGTETVLHSFLGGTDGAYPVGDLIADTQGNLYGSAGGGPTNDGVVFKIAPDGTETILYTFCSQRKCADGGGPGNLVMDSQGNLYGPASYGGYSHGACYSSGCGVVFKIAPDGTETVLYAFAGGSDGGAPDALVLDGAGNLYGATAQGGNRVNCEFDKYGCGTIFEIPANGTKKTLYTFCSQPNCPDGWNPTADLLLDHQGNVIGPTCCAESGTVLFKVAPDGEETVLHTFNGPPDGVSPMGGLVMDKKGNLYGATLQGGSGSGCPGEIGCGMVFKLAPGGEITTLHSFVPGKGGTSPYGGVIADKAGNLFGTTGFGGAKDHGVVFEITKK
jgi:uncharacterized repeat protein (TIGR03803 family)